MNVLILLAGLVGVAVALNLLSEVTKSANDYVTRTRDEALTLSPLPDKLLTLKPVLAARLRGHDGGEALGCHSRASGNPVLGKDICNSL